GGRQPAAYQGAAQNQGSPPQVANDNGGMHPVAAQILPLVTAHIEQTVHNDVQAALGTVKLASAAMTRLENLVRTEMDTVLGSDANYQNRLQALFRSGNAERSRQFIQASLDQIRPRITRQIVNEMYGPRPAQAAQPARVKPGARPQAPEGTTQLSRPPRHDDIDWSKTDTTAMIAHRAVLKDGRSVRWPYSTK
ncbi:MAG: hypothetical protein ACRD22_03325, partial [Terriglobia bacterium]